jgi:parvulin-like peptidyl-prolyl isomerase
VLNKFRKKVSKKNAPNQDSGLPRITNETLAETRVEVLKGARKFVYPIQHSKHRIVIYSSLLGLAVLLSFAAYSTWALYFQKNTSTLMYRVTQIIPYPLAKVGSSFISYEDYMFEIRQYVHYFEKQEKLDFSQPENKQQLESQRKEALDRTIKKFYVKKLAKANGVVVSDDEVNKEVELYQSQNRLGNDEQVLKDVLKDYYGWTINDFKRQLTSRILAEKLIDELDSSARERANLALDELKAGADFAAVADKYTDDTNTKGKGGEIPFLIDEQDRNVPSQMTKQLFALQPGQYSDIFSVGYGLEIVKNLENKDGKIRAAYILFNYKNIENFINAEKEKSPATVYLKL